MRDEDFRGGGVPLVLVDEPQDREVSWDAQEHVCELQTEIPDEDCGHFSAALIDRLSASEVWRSVRDEERRKVEVWKVHVSRSDLPEKQRSVK